MIKIPVKIKVPCLITDRVCDIIRTHKTNERKKIKRQVDKLMKDLEQYL